MAELQQRWTHLYKVHLPKLAKARDPVQAHWPVQLDHCFARIILDNAVGRDRPWTETIKSPAYKNMTRTQLEDAIDLGERLATGQEDLVSCDEQSLKLRGKPTKANTAAKRKSSGDSTDQQSPKKPRTTETISSHFATLKSSKAKPTESPSSLTNPITGAPCPSAPPHDLIRSSTLTPFRKQVLTLLTQVPAGHHTTYAALAAHISASSHKTCARAVGNAMRNNPFAPAVPCHRVLAADGRIGGFGGDWGEEGRHAAQKKKMLREEGVKFDGAGKVVGRVFVGFEGDGKV